jgi:prepilin-type N-terminal cleavage/methylation domain-containing protein
MKTQLKKKTEGFTIIEVLIVLVIAGLIMLIVFLAVPALQRNSRNTQRRTEASRIVSGASEWRTNNANAWPATCFPVLAACSGAPDTTRTAILTNAGSLSIYGGSALNILANTTGQTGNLATSALGTTITTNQSLIIMLGQAKCTNNDVQSGTSIVVVYAVETGGNATATCISS